MEEYGFMKRLALLTLFCSLATGVIAAPNDGWNEGMILFKKEILQIQIIIEFLLLQLLPKVL